MAYNINKIKEFCKSLNLECVSDIYIDSKHNLKFICTNCSDIFERTFDNLKTRKSTICRNCAMKNANKPNKLEFEYVKSFIENNDCILISEEYFNTDTKLKIKCNCGNIFETTFYKFDKRNKRQCNECGYNITRIKNMTPLDEIKNMVTQDGYALLASVLEDSIQRILVKCDKNHDPYWVNACKFKTGRRCPHCQRSLGEEAILKELDILNVIYQREFKFDDLIGIGGGSLRFDFAILDKSNNIKCIIEYDGLQHFEIAFNSIKTFKRTQIHDKMKNEYCVKRNIPLYRINYKEYENIHKIITNIINQV